MIRATTFAGKTVAVFGLGASGIATVRALLEGGATVAAWDDSEASRAAAAKAGISIVDLTNADWSGFSSLLLAPGVPLTDPEPHWTVTRAKDAGVEVIGDIEIFCRERSAHCPNAPFIGITGTNGKSTTTALAAHILKHAGYRVEMGGNIGRAVLTLDQPSATTFYVLELSSFQIDLTPSLNASVGVLLNITPDHIDRHGTIERYASVKQRLVDGAIVACIGIDDDWSRASLKRRISAQGAACAFSVQRKLAPGYSLDGDTLVCANREGLAIKLATLSGVGALRGAHNAQNALAACAAVRECLNLHGLSNEIDWQGAISSFPGLAHRCEEIGHQGKVVFINDSKATNADSAEKALLSFPRDVYWILGGKPKEGGITPLAPYFKGITRAYLIGEASEAFAQTLTQGQVPFERSGTLDAALAQAARDASESQGREPVVLLSPACASYDQFKNFEVRGDAFRALVAALPGIALKGAK